MTARARCAHARPVSASRDAKIYGLHACMALARRRPDAVQRAFFHRDVAKRFGELTSALARRRRPYRVVDDEELARVAGSRHHEGVCLVADPLEPPSLDELLASLPTVARLVFLDGVHNPHNVGVILRTAAHFGAAAVLAWEEDVPTPAGATARVAEGAAEHVPLVRLQDPRAALERLGDEGFGRVATVVRGGGSLFDAPLPARVLFLLGAERDGLSEPARELADAALTIPGTGLVESLNVATACAALLSEHARQHRP